jgi:CIC family chloride channel protein
MNDAEPENHSVPSNPFHWFPEFLEIGKKRMKSQARLLGLSLVVGIISGLGAIVFYVACQFVFHVSLDGIAGYRPSSPGGEPSLFKDTMTEFRPWLLLIVPTVGGLLSGLIVYTFAPEAEGHGTDSVIAAYHLHQGLIRPRVPLVKIISSALTVSTGGSGGREGPIAQIGAGFGSFLGSALHLRPVDRRILMAAGMGAGIAAIFRAPLAGALFAAEVLYRSPDFESEVIMPSALASISAYCTFSLAFGWSPLFSLSPDVLSLLRFDNPLELIPYTVLALFSVVLAMLYTRSFYWLTYLFHQIRLPRHFVPAIGAFLSGLLGLVLYYTFGRDMTVLGVLSFGYGTLQEAMTLSPNDHTLYMGLILLAIALGKMMTTGMTIGSGGSGGVFGPSMVIGGCGGGALGIFLHLLWPTMAPHPTNFVLVGMAGFFAAAAKTPFSTLVIVSEMTGSYSLLLPTFWVCTLAFLLSDEQSIYSAQVESPARSPAHQAEFVQGMLSGLSVSQFVNRDELPRVLRLEDRLESVLGRMSEDPHAVVPVADADGKLLGVVSVEEVYLAMQIRDAPSVVQVADLMRSDVVPLQFNDSVDRAMELFAENDLLQLPVVDDSTQNKVLGVVSRAEISRTYLRHVQGTAAQLKKDSTNEPS